MDARLNIFVSIQANDTKSFDRKVHFNLTKDTKSLTSPQKTTDPFLHMKLDNQSLETALSCPDSSLAKQLLEEGAPVCNLIFPINKINSSETAKATAELFCQKSAELFIAYYIHKLEPFFNSLLNPIFCGRAEIDFFTNLFIKREFWVSEEEINARRMIQVGTETKKLLESSYHLIKGFLDKPETLSLEEKLDLLANAYQTLQDKLFTIYFIQYLPTKRSEALYSELLYTKNPGAMSPNYWVSAIKRDRFSSHAVGGLGHINYRLGLMKFETLELPLLKKSHHLEIKPK